MGAAWACRLVSLGCQLVALGCLVLGAPPAWADSAGKALSGVSTFCNATSTATPAQQDRLLRLAAIVKETLDASGHGVALVSRNGTNLQRFGLRYSHAGISIKSHDDGPWTVRQLYYACDEQRPRVFDQGMSGFLLGTDNLDQSYVSMVLLPHAEGLALQLAAQDRPRALRLLASTYSANAHPFSLLYQNCNQWVAELMATAWGMLPDGDDLRARAQGWLRLQGYAPAPVNVGSHWLMALAPFSSMVHLDDHPQEDRDALQLRTSLPDAIEAFVRERVPGAQRVELCHTEQHVVVRTGWAPMLDGCVAQAGDRVIAWH